MRKRARLLALTAVVSTIGAVACAHERDAGAERPAAPAEAPADAGATAPAERAQAPMYKPSSRSKAPMSIADNAYGAFWHAKTAPGIGETAPAFTLPAIDGKPWTLADARQQGPVVIVFYRGFW